MDSAGWYRRFFDSHKRMRREFGYLHAARLERPCDGL